MKKTLTVLIIGVLLVSIFSVLGLASPDSVPNIDSGWTKTYGGVADDLAFTFVRTSDGGYALAGYTLSYNIGLTDFYLVKTDGLGSVQWNRSYGGMHDEIVNTVLQTNDGGYTLVGYSSSFTSTDDAYLIKTDPLGNVQWSMTYGGMNDDFANSGVQTSDGGFMLAGQTRSFGAGGYDFYLIKTDSSGNMQWSRTYGGTNDDYAQSIVQSSDGGYALAGLGFANLLKIDANGNVLWSKFYGGSFYAVVQTSDGGYALAGSANFVKTDSNGNVLWSKSYGAGGFYAVVNTTDGGYALAGWTRYPGFDDTDALLLKTDSSGNMQWSKTYGGTQDECAWGVIQTSDGGHALVGYTNSFGAGGYDFYLIKTDSLGNDHDPFHDVAVTNVHALKNVVDNSSICRMNVTVVNWGDFIETFNLTAWVMIALPTSVQNVSILDLLPHEARTITTLWNITDWSYGNYTVGAAAATVPQEVDTANNVCTDGWVTITMQGDVNGDKTVNLLDLIMIATRLGQSDGGGYALYSTAWYKCMNTDLNNDGVHNVLDLIICATHLGQHSS